jgi:hypothetical protein
MRRSLRNTTLNRLLAISSLTVFIAISGGLVFFYANCANCEFSPRLFLTMFASGISVVLFVVGWGLGAIGIVRLFANTFKVAANPNATIGEAPYWIRRNRNNLLFCPQYLNERGLEARRKAFNSFLLFALGVALAIPAILVAETL